VIISVTMVTPVGSGRQPGTPPAVYRAAGGDVPQDEAESGPNDPAETPGLPRGSRHRSRHTPAQSVELRFWHGEGERYHNVASRLRAAIKALVEHKDPAQRVKRFRVHDLRRRRRSHRRAGGLRDGGALMRVILENLDAADLGPVTVIGRDAWALVELHCAGEAGYTPMTHPGLGRRNG
jgi:hypothetical protein